MNTIELCQLLLLKRVKSDLRNISSIFQLRPRMLKASNLQSANNYKTRSIQCHYLDNSSDSIKVFCLVSIFLL